MKHRVRIVGKWFIGLPFLVVYLACWALPASYWFDSRSLKVSDATVGEAPTVIEDRHIRWSFIGSFSTATRYAEQPEVIVGGCFGSDEIRYRGGLDGTKSYDLADWTGKEACRRLPAGTYFVEVCRTILRPMWGILPRKSTCTQSNVFSVREGQ